jgi:hypothetical protein
VQGEWASLRLFYIIRGEAGARATRRTRRRRRASGVGLAVGGRGSSHSICQIEMMGRGDFAINSYWHTRTDSPHNTLYVVLATVFTPRWMISRLAECNLESLEELSLDIPLCSPFLASKNCLSVSSQTHCPFYTCPRPNSSTLLSAEIH